MKAVVLSSHRHQKALDRFPEAYVDSELDVRIRDAATQLSKAFADETASPKQEQAYTDALVWFGILATAKYHYKMPVRNDHPFEPAWLSSARKELENHVAEHPDMDNLFRTSFFSGNVRLWDQLDRDIYGSVKERGQSDLNARQFATALALDEVLIVDFLEL